VVAESTIIHKKNNMLFLLKKSDVMDTGPVGIDKYNKKERNTNTTTKHFYY
jgi:hypothetical protein